MADDTLLYHWSLAPEGQRFDVTSVCLETLAKEGWVDNPAKIGLNPWGPDQAVGVAANHDRYRRGEIPGMDQMDHTQGFSAASQSTNVPTDFSSTLRAKYNTSRVGSHS